MRGSYSCSFCMLSWYVVVAVASDLMPYAIAVIVLLVANCPNDDWLIVDLP